MGQILLFSYLFINAILEKSRFRNYCHFTYWAESLQFRINPHQLYRFDLVYIWKNWHLCLFLLFTEICYWQRYQTDDRTEKLKWSIVILILLWIHVFMVLGAFLTNLRWWKLWVINKFQNNLLNKARQFPIKCQFQVWK